LEVLIGHHKNEKKKKKKIWETILTEVFRKGDISV